MAVDNTPRVYADADVFLHVLLNQEHADICAAVLEAAKRKDIRLVASRLLMVEVGGHGYLADSTERPGIERANALIGDYLDLVDTEWVELDLVTAREAQQLAWDYKLRSSDAVHLATALRRNANYFMSYDEKFPFGTTIGRTEVLRPAVVWQPTLEDGLVA